MLTSKQEHFAVEFVRLGVASEAYKCAYAVAPTTSQKSVWEQSSRLLHNRKVASRIAELRQSVVDDLKLSVGHMALELSQNRMNALEAGKIDIAHASTVAKARILGFL